MYFKKRKVELSLFDHKSPLGMKCLWKLSGELGHSLESVILVH